VRRIPGKADTSDFAVEDTLYRRRKRKGGSPGNKGTARADVAEEDVGMLKGSRMVAGWRVVEDVVDKEVRPRRRGWRQGRSSR